MPDKQMKSAKEAADAATDEPAANDHYDKSWRRLSKAHRNTEQSVSMPC